MTVPFEGFPGPMPAREVIYGYAEDHRLSPEMPEADALRTFLAVDQVTRLSLERNDTETSGDYFQDVRRVTAAAYELLARTRLDVPIDEADVGSPDDADEDPVMRAAAELAGPYVALMESGQVDITGEAGLTPTAAAELFHRANLAGLTAASAPDDIIAKFTALDDIAESWLERYIGVGPDPGAVDPAAAVEVISRMSGYYLTAASLILGIDPESNEWADLLLEASIAADMYLDSTNGGAADSGTLDS